MKKKKKNTIFVKTMVFIRKYQIVHNLMDEPYHSVSDNGSSIIF